MALGVLRDPGGRRRAFATRSGRAGPLAHRAAAAALRQRVARGLFPVDEAWGLTCDAARQRRPGVAPRGPLGGPSLRRRHRRARRPTSAGRRRPRRRGGRHRGARRRSHGCARPTSSGRTAGAVAPGALRPLTGRPGVGQTAGAMTNSSRFARRLIPRDPLRPPCWRATRSVPRRPGPPTSPTGRTRRSSGINKLDPHAPVYPFADEATARGARPLEVALLPAPERPVEVPLLAQPGGAPEDVLRDRLRRRRVGHDPGPLEHREARLRAAALREHRLRLGLGHAAPRAARPELRRLVPAPLRGARLLAGPPRPDHLPGRLRRLLPLGEREEGRLQRGQPRARRVRRHGRRRGRARTCSPSRCTASPTAPTSSARTSGGCPGIFRDVVLWSTDARPRRGLPGGDRPRRAVPRRHAEARRDGGRRGRRRAGLHPRGGAPGPRRRPPSRASLSCTRDAWRGTTRASCPWRPRWPTPSSGPTRSRTSTPCC